jgi:F-type H+-transporting ATPase subunit b
VVRAPPIGVTDHGAEPAVAENHSTGTEATPASEHGGGFPPFQKDTFGSQLLWLAIFFVALYLIAAKLALPRVGSIIADRRKRISGDLAEAARMKDAADAAIATYEKALADARARAQAMAAESRDKVNAEAEANRKAVEASLHGKLTAAEQTIAATRTAAMANVQSIAQELAIAIVERLTGKAPSKATAAAAVKAAIKR